VAIKDVFHVNVNCTDFERSLAFYELVGFQIAHDLGVGEGGPYRVGLGMPEQSANRAALLVLDPTRRGSTRIDLIEWIEPKTHGTATHRRPDSDLAHVGAARIALWTIGVDEEYARLRDAGVEFITEPVTMNDGTTRFCCFYDPDGTILELIDFGPQ
jgi:catechol 2,3-dioxygenase-like lactoylglutathione lyase family enzyme